MRACGQAGRWSNVGCETPASAGSRGPPQSVPLREVSQHVRDFRIALALLTPAVLSAQWSTSWRAGGAVEPPSPQWSCSVTLRRHQLPGGALLSTRWSGRRSGGESSLDQCNCAAGKPWCAVAQQSCVACGAGWRMFRSRPYEITVRHAGSCSGYWCCSASRGGRRQFSNGPLRPQDGTEMAEEGHPSPLFLVPMLALVLVLTPASQ